MCTERAHRWPSQLEEERRTWFSLSRQKGSEGERRGGRLLRGKEEGKKSPVLLLLLYLMGRGENSSSTRRGVLDLRVSTPANVSNASSEGDPTSCQEPVRTRDALDPAWISALPLSPRSSSLQSARNANKLEEVGQSTRRPWDDTNLLLFPSQSSSLSLPSRVFVSFSNNWCLSSWQKEPTLADLRSRLLRTSRRKAGPCSI